MRWRRRSPSAIVKQHFQLAGYAMAKAIEENDIVRYLSVDDRDDETEDYYRRELWRMVKQESLPDDIYIRFPNGRYVKCRVEEWHDNILPGDVKEIVP